MFYKQNVICCVLILIKFIKIILQLVQLVNLYEQNGEKQKFAISMSSVLQSEHYHFNVK